MALPLGVLLRRALCFMTASLATLLRGLCAYCHELPRIYSIEVKRSFSNMTKVANTTLPDHHQIYSWSV